MPDERFKEGFGFVIKGKYLKGNVPKQASFRENRQEFDADNRPAYFPKKKNGWCDIEDDEYYAVVVVAPDDILTMVEDLPIPRLPAIDSSLVANYRRLSEGDVRIFQLPYKDV
jgi:hypothetical protein